MSDAENAPHHDPVESNNGGTEPEPTVQHGDSFGGTSIDPNSIEGVFLLALQKEQPEEREAYLDEVCGDDDDRRYRVKALLRAFDDAGSFLETPAGGPRPQQEISLSFLQPIDKEGCLGTIGPYEVLEVIGRGGMGVVLRAVDLKLKRVVAVKVLLPELAANPNARRRFLREAQAAAAVSHPHVVTIHAVEEAHGNGTDKPVPPYLVMECVVGQSLQEKLDNVGSLRLAETLRISRQIGEGLDAAHKQGLIHRDIKPANILLENGVERVKITDFGLARAIDDITVTRTGEVSGTPQYMSPEQASGERVDHRSDLFSLGCVMYAMCTGHSPFRGDSLAHVIKRVTQDTPRPIAEQNAEVPPWLVQIIDCLLQKNPDHRFQSAEGLEAILEQHLARIQQPTDSGSHSVINQQMGVEPATAAAYGQTTVLAVPTAEPLPSDAASTQSITSHRAGTYLVALGALIIFGLVASVLLVATNIVDASRNVRNASDAILGVGMGIATVFLVAGMLLREEILGHETWTEMFQLAGCTLLGPIGIGWWLNREKSRAEENVVARSPSAGPPPPTFVPQSESRAEHNSRTAPTPPRTAPAATRSVSEEGIAWDTDPPEVEVPNSFRIGGVALVVFGLIAPLASFLQGLFDVPGPLGLVVVCFGCIWPITTGLCLRRRQMTRDGLLMIAFLALGPVGLLMYFFQKDQLRPAEIDHVGRRRKREQRDKWGVGLQGVGASIVFFGLIGLVLMMLDVLVFGRRNTPPTVASVLGVGALLLIVGTMLRENTDGRPTMLLPLYFLLGPFGLVLWLVEWDSRRRRQPAGGASLRLPEPVSRSTESSQVSARPAVPAVPLPPPENAFTSREPSAVSSSTHTEPHAASPSPQQKRLDAKPQAELVQSQNTSESTHGRTGRWLVSLGLFLVVSPVATVACGFFVDGDVMEFGSLLGMVAVPVGLLAIIVGYVLRYIIDKEQQHHRPLQPGIPIIMATVLAAIGAAVHGFVEQSAVPHGSEAVQRSEIGNASERDRRSLPEQLNTAVNPSQSARPDERGGPQETVVMSAHPAKGERAGTLNVAIHDDGMRVVLRRKSAFGGYVSGSEQQVTKVGDSSLRLHPGDYEVGIQDRNFGWADQYRVQDVAIVDGISEDVDVFRDVLQLEPVLGETTFYWNRELGAKTKTNGQVHAINRLVEAMNRDEHEVRENELIPHVKQQIIHGFPGGGEKIANEIHTFADIFSPLPACIVPGKQDNTFRLAPVQQVTLRIALVDDGLHMRLTANDNDADVSPRTLDGRFGRNEAEYRLPPGQYQLVVSDTLANWEKKGTGSGLVQSTNLTKRTINLDLKNEQLEEVAIKRDLEGLAEYDIDGLQLNDAERLAFSWGRSGGFGGSHSLELNQTQAKCVQRLLRAMLEGNAEVKDSELREITGHPTDELFPGIATDAIYSGDEDFRYRKLIVPGNSENTWRLLRLGNDE